MGLRRPLLALACALVVALPASAAPEGAFPGGNGAIAYLNPQHPFLWVMNPDGSGAHQLLAARDPVAAWSPDGRRLAYLKSSSDDGALHVVNADGSGDHLVARTVWSKPSWSPSGDEIAVVLGDGRVQVMAVRANGSGQRQIGTWWSSGVLEPEDVAWSVTGKLAVTYTTDESGGHSAVATMNADGGDLHEIVTVGDRHLNPPEHPSWSPDGARIAFWGQLTSNSSHIYVANADGSHLHAVTDGSDKRDPVWSPDGTKIAFRVGSSYGDSFLHVMNADGSNGHTIGRGLFPDWQACSAGANCRLRGGLMPQLEAGVGDAGIAPLTLNGARVSTLKPGGYTIQIGVHSRRNNFHLIGPGVNRKTRLGRFGEFTWSVTLKPGRYIYRSDAPGRLRRSFSVAR